MLVRGIKTQVSICNFTVTKNMYQLQVIYRASKAFENWIIKVIGLMDFCSPDSFSHTLVSQAKTKFVPYRSFVPRTFTS